MDFQSFNTLLHKIFAQDAEINNLPLETLLDAIPRVDSLSELPSGTPVLIRVDIDVPVKDGAVKDMSRIESIAQTIKFTYDKGWKTILFGHVGRDKTNTALPIVKAISDYTSLPVTFIPEWLDEAKNKLTDDVVEKVKSAEPKSIFLLENTRKYDMERALWKATEETFPAISEKMYTVSKDISDRLTQVEINEAIAASNVDFSSVAIPLLMKKTALGFYIADEMQTHIRNVRNANFVVMSGIKMDKLDDLEGMVERGNLKLIFTAGALAMPLLKAKSELEGVEFSAGAAENDPASEAYVEPKRFDQAKEIMQICQDNNIDVVFPVDFILENGEASKTIPEGRTQLDIGPETRKLFAEKIRSYIEESKTAQTPYVMFHNGVFGKFEDPLFENGTKEFIPLLKQMTLAGIKTYVGGGEGRVALEKYGSLDDVTHAFTAGGTILTSLTNNHIAYLKAMYLQNTVQPH